MSLLHAFRRPYPIDIEWGVVLRRAAAVGLFVWAFLFLFAPFGLIQLELWSRLRITLSYGAVTTVCVGAMTGLLPRVWRTAFEERGWTLGRQVCATLAMLAAIGTGNWALSAAYGFVSVRAHGFVLMLVYTVLVGLFPIILNALLLQLRLERKYRTQALEMLARLPQERASNAQVAEPASREASHAPGPDLISLHGTLANEHVTLDPQAVLMLSSADNYVEVNYEQNGTTVRLLLRLSLTAAEAQLAEHGHLMRVHRRFIVNLHRIRHISGNAQGYRLRLDGLTDEVPVSRAYLAGIRARLSGVSPAPKA